MRRGWAAGGMATLLVAGASIWEAQPGARCGEPDPVRGELRSGDLIFFATRTVRGAVVRLLSLGEQTDFSHVGVGVVRDGRVWVAHASPGAGAAVTEPLGDVLRAIRVDAYAVYRLRADPQRVARAAGAAEAFAVEHRPFDHDFELESDERLYCTELVAKAYRDADLHLRSDLLEAPKARLLPADLAADPQLAPVWTCS